MSTLPVRTLEQIGHLTWVATRRGGGFDAAFADSDDAIRHAMATGGALGHTLLGWIDMFSPSATFEANQAQVVAFLDRGDEFDRVMSEA
ncbi:hypothetical protein CcrColossus_gp008 [Caulobacter phage CcrColossus]|uniref:Uncharacterized protein n=1 Tax=Caulobacter phage CcrColossus TaxID=1211640 RepID=K4JVL5_9CAUD|nr:hypothetical protein CcrColossus_gp008 [Caulobacter phage CcrColossus]AFU87878.1 hypothetical protein CcrColossus_gp008 [Caulobacter phage CcrColossus]